MFPSFQETVKSCIGNYGQLVLAMKRRHFSDKWANKAISNCGSDLEDRHSGFMKPNTSDYLASWSRKLQVQEAKGNLLLKMRPLGDLFDQKGCLGDSSRLKTTHLGTLLNCNYKCCKMGPLQPSQWKMWPCCKNRNLERPLCL